MLVLLSAAGIQLALRMARPMLSNSFVRNDRMPFYYWWTSPPVVDASENAAIADYRLNLLVVFLTGSSGIEPGDFWFHRETAEGAVFHADRGGEIEFIVPRREDVAMVFRADGSREEVPLAPGEAKIIHDRLANETEDFAIALPRVYAEEHRKPDQESVR